MILKKSSVPFFDRLRMAGVPSLGVFALVFSFASLLILLSYIFVAGLDRLSFDFLLNYPSRFPDKAGVKSAIVGTLYVMFLTALFSIPLGVLSAIYLEEYAPKNRLTNFIRLNIANLAAVPSIVYGLLGLALFVRWLSFDRSVLSGALTMSLLILPVIIIASSEALRAVPQSIRDAAHGLGATKTQVVFEQVLPLAWSGVLTGVILALSRAVGETAPLLAVGALAFAAFTPEGPMDEFTALSVQIYNWASRPQAEFHELAASAILVLLTLSLGMNALAIWLRLKMTKRSLG